MSKTIVIVGGGFAGVYCAHYLERRLPRDWELIVFSEENFLTFTPMLAEVVGSSINPQHVVRPVRQMLRRSLCRTAAVTKLDLGAGRVEYQLPDKRTASQPYDHLVLACGMVVNVDVIPGVAAQAFPLKTLGDALVLRNHVLSQLERAEVETDSECRRRLLSFAVIGGGFSGVEVAGEIYDLLTAGLPYYRSLRRDEVRVVILHGPKRLLPEMPESLGEYARRRMEARGLVIRLETQARAVTPEGVKLADGSLVPAGTVVCTIGNTVSPLMAASGLPLERGRLRTEPDMRVPGHRNVWALGDCAVVPNARDGQPSPTLAQFALRQAKQLAANLRRELAGKPTRPFSFRMLGSFAAIGHHNAVGNILGLKVSGFFAWFLWRTVYLSKMPSLARKVQIAFDWAWDLFFPRDLVQVSPRTTDRMPRAHYEAGEYVVRQGDAGDAVYVIERGRASVLADGQEEPVATLGPGDAVGEAALLSGGAHPASVRAEGPLDVLVLERERFEDLTSHAPALRTALTELTGRHLAALRFRELARHDAQLGAIRVQDVMTTPVPMISAATTMEQLAARLEAEGAGPYAVVDEQGRLEGVCTADELLAALAVPRPLSTPVAEIMTRPAPVAVASKPLVDVLPAFYEGTAKHFIVVAEEGEGRPVGLLTPLGALLHYTRGKTQGDVGSVRPSAVPVA